MVRNLIRTHKRIASAASKALRNTKTARVIRSIAGSALVNRKRGSKLG